MPINKDIYDIIAHLVLGTVTDDEMRVLDRWLAESPKHKLLLDTFLQRSDMSALMDMPKEHRDAEALFARGRINMRLRPLRQHLQPLWHSIGSMRNIAAVAAVAVLVVGIVWWNKYTEVVMPELGAEYVAAIEQAQQSGHSDAEVIITTNPKLAITQQTKGNGTMAAVVQNEAAISDIIENMGLSDAQPTDADVEIVTKHDKEFWMTLPDGTRVHLNYGSRLHYPLAFTGKTRDVTLEGEAYFFVTKDRRHPFIVHTKQGDIKEYGTEFVVNTNYSASSTMPGAASGQTKPSTSVVLVSGSISVIPHGGREHMIKPSDMAVLTSGSPRAEIQKVDTTPYTAWNTGTFAFDDCPMDKLMTVLGRWYNLHIAFADDKARSIPFTGELDRYGDISHAIHAIHTITGLTIRIEDRTIVVE